MTDHMPMHEYYRKQRIIFPIIGLALVCGAALGARAWLRHRAYIADAREALEALQAVQSVVSVGVTYQDYGRRVQDARIAVDRFQRTYIGWKPMPAGYWDIEEAMKTYEDASTWWQSKFDAPEYRKEHFQDRVQTEWALADAQLRCADLDIEDIPYSDRKLDRDPNSLNIALARFNHLTAQLGALGDLLTAHDASDEETLSGDMKYVRDRRKKFAAAIAQMAPELVRSYDSDGTPRLAMAADIGK